jgi:hypothetical protein
MRRSFLFLALVALCPAAGLVAWLGSRGQAQPSKPPDAPARQRVPLARVVLFNTGVGYFQREGEIDGSAKVDLSFPASNLNDLLKTIKIDDGGKPGVVSYDGPDQIEQGLRAFAVDLSGNPTFGEILNQARGSKVEVTLDSGTSPVTGTVVGMEAAFENNAESHHLNVLAADGMRRLPLGRVQRLRFLDPAREDEFRRALGALASHNSGTRREVSLHLQGAGQRPVKVGYVVETPIWRASYRLALDTAKPTLHCSAVVENNTEEDWKDVRLTLVSGRPVTFEMDLAQPLYVPRPRIEPEVYASLRPPMHDPTKPPNATAGFQGGGGFQLGGLGALGGGLGALGGQPQKPLDEAPGDGAAVRPGTVQNRYQVPPSSATAAPRLTWEELRQRQQAALQGKRDAIQQAARVGSALALDERLEGIALDADRIGKGFRQTLPQKLTLSRQKSALVPVIHEAVEVTRYSIYDRRVHPHFPMHGAKLKNTTKAHLMQGPMSVFDADGYLGDCRLPDLAPGEDRLISYAMDLGLEVRPEAVVEAAALERLEIAKGHLHSHVRHTRETPFQIRNRSDQERTLLVEHAQLPGWELVGKDRLVETTPAAYRVAWKVPAGAGPRHLVTLERKEKTAEPLALMSDARLREFTRLDVATKPILDALAKVLDYRERLAKLTEQRSSAQRKLDELTRDQGALRHHLGTLVAGSPAHKRDLAKFEAQEARIEEMRKDVIERHVAEGKLRAEYETFLLGLAAR